MSCRKSITFAILAVIILMFTAWTPAQAVPRQCSILEGFTQWNCPPCATWNPQENTVLEQMTRDSVISIKYHVTWPGANNDIYNHWNATENGQRTNMYSVSAVPESFLEGAGQSQTQSALRNAVRNNMAENCPCTIDITALYAGATSVSFSGSILAESDLNGLRFFVALITNEEHAPPQGSNGETDWFDVFRDMYPNANSGLALTAGPGDTQEFSGTLNCDADWDPANMHVVAFVQNMGTREIVQGENTIVEQNYGMSLTSNELYQRMIAPSDQEYTYTLYVDHVGLLDDDYAVNLLGNFPEGWTYTIEATSVPPHESIIQVSLSNLETSELLVRLNPNGNPGFAEFTVDVQSQGEILVHGDMTFRIMGGLEILVVDDDAGDDYEDYFMDAITPYTDATGMVLGIWDVDRDFLDNSYFGTTDIVVWFTGNSFQNGETIAPFDQLILSDYLNAGGKLLLSGQGIGFDIRTDQFITSHLHINYMMPWPQGDEIEGYAGDPISDGMTFDFNAGEGANNQSRQHRIISRDEFATPILRFDIADDSADCAMRIETDVYRTIYFAFGLEGISNNQVRSDLMEYSLDWLRGVEATEKAPVTLPAEFSLSQNFPNPFNPETAIPFTLAEHSMVTLNVYDVLGREVTQLVSGFHEAGIHSVNWNASHLSSGIYFYTLEAITGNNTFRSTRKMVLMK